MFFTQKKVFFIAKGKTATLYTHGVQRQIFIQTRSIAYTYVKYIVAIYGYILVADEDITISECICDKNREKGQGIFNHQKN